MSNLPIVEDFLCVRCARTRKTCCQHTEIYTTLDDVKRIEAFSGRNDFTEFRPAGDPLYVDQDDDPTWFKYVFQADGTRRVLKHQENGDCTFLGEQGCRLTLETRPLVCRLFPFDYTAEGLRETFAEGCPLEMLTEGQSLTQALNLSQEDAMRWHQQLYQEMQAEKVFDDEPNHHTINSKQREDSYQ